MRFTNILLAVAIVVTITLFGVTMQPATSEAADSVTAPVNRSDIRVLAMELDTNDRPAVVFMDSTDSGIRLLRCGSARCDVGNTVTEPVPDVPTSSFRGFALDEADKPIIVYHDFNARVSVVLHCANLSCTSTLDTTATPVDDENFSAATLHLDAGGLPHVTYTNFVTGASKVLQCGDLGCLNQTTITDTTLPTPFTSRVVLDAEDHPVFVASGSQAGEFVLHHCGNQTCSAGNTARTLTGVTSAGDLALNHLGHPVLAYFEPVGRDLGVAICSDEECDGPITVTTPDTRGQTGETPSLVIDEAGRPVVAYQGFLGLQVLQCGNATCTDGNTVSDPSCCFSPKLALNRDGNPVVAFTSPTLADFTEDLRILVCDDPGCIETRCNGLIVTRDMNKGASGIGTSQGDVILGTPGDDIIEAGAGNNTVCGMGGDDIISGGGGFDTLLGGDGDDKIFGFGSADTIEGGPGDDIIHGHGGNDDLDGGPGADRMFGYAGDDRIVGGGGDDRLHGNFGNDTILGQGGDDRMFGYGDNDFLQGGLGNDLLGGNFGDDRLEGNDGNDTLYGSDGFDIVIGGSGNDELDGNSGPDSINGGPGNDTIDGGIGSDICDGGSDVDTAGRCETVTNVP